MKCVAVIAHGIGMTKAVSGEGQVYMNFFEMLRNRSLNYVAVSFGKPKYEVPSRYFLPFSIPKFDKYQRILTYLAARKIKPDLFLNASGVPIPVSKIAPHVIYAGGPAISSLPSKYSRSLFWKLYLLPFRTIVSKFKEEAGRSEFIANSRYSARAIAEVFSIQEPKVVYPPVDVDFFSRGFSETKGKKQFLTIARIERGKMIENAVRVSVISGVRGIVVGSLIERGYLEELKRLIKREGADVDIVVNAKREMIVEIMKETPVYFHPTIGEHFGIPVVEAMSAGLIPVTPRNSGASEIVPEFAYEDLEEAGEKVRKALDSLREMRKSLFVRAQEFRKETFQDKIYDEISKYLDHH